VENVKDKDGSLCFTATATYPCRATSNLSEVYCATFNDSKIANNVSSKIITLTPNPVCDYLKTGLAEDVSYQIYSVDGSLVMSGKIVQEGVCSAEIDVQHLQPGKYLIELKGKNSKKVGTFIKR
jgi:hypothetical protein